MKPALAAAALVLAAALPVTAATAGTDDGLLVIEGAGNSTGELVLRAPADVDGAGTLTGGDAYAGVLIEPVGASMGRFGLLQVRAFRDGTQTALAQLGIAGRLEAGRYRVTVLGDRPVRATFALADTSAPVLRVRARTRLAVTFLGRAEEVPAGRSRAAVRFPRSLPAGKQALIGSLMRGVRIDDQQMCATRSTACRSGLPTSIATDDEALLTVLPVPATSQVRDLL
ncbi:MAG: hypothetical protein H7323_12000, partial [Frankiales bacterium]|nr:hypothetical protein [Frankiales bacterium]